MEDLVDYTLLTTCPAARLLRAAAERVRMTGTNYALVIELLKAAEQEEVSRPRN